MRLRRITTEPDYAGIFYRKEKYSHDPELMEAYECGFADAMRKVYDEDGYHERRSGVTHLGAGGRILYRHDPDREMWDDDDIEYRRRRRNSRGEFI